jgi:ribose-phosphate pyrophosphokinase
MRRLVKRKRGKVVVLGGPAGSNLDGGIARALGAQLVRAHLRTFPDGESLIKVPANLRGKEVVIVQSTYQPQDTHIMQLLFMAQIASEMRARSITAVIPYLAYMRQNRSFAAGEAASVSTLLKSLYSAGIESLLTVEPHKSDALASFKGRKLILSPIARLMDPVSKNNRDPFVLAPDKGSLLRAKAAAEALGCDYTHIDKERNPVTGAVSLKGPAHKSFVDMEVVIVDDMISTGGTIALASKYAYANGAADVSVAAVHLLMCGSAYHRIRQAGISRIYGTNTIPYENAMIVDISTEMAELLEWR